MDEDPSAAASTSDYLNSLQRFADDGRSLMNAPQRYSSKHWWTNIQSMFNDQILQAISGQVSLLPLSAA